MIRKLKIRFVVLAMTALFCLLAVIVTGMTLYNYNAVITDADEVISLLAQNRGTFPQRLNNNEYDIPPGMSPELPYEARFFTIELSSSNEIIRTDTGNIVSIDEEEAIEYAEKIMENDSQSGFIDEFRYVVDEKEHGTTIIFLDCGRKLDSFRSFLYGSILMSLIGYVITSIIIFIFSGKIVRPIAESYEKQRRFITDAGHEIKTPLTIISANADLLEADLGSNESLMDIQQQTKRLRSLTEDLVALAHMEEVDKSIPKIEFPLSEVIEDAAFPFRAMAQAQGKEFLCNVQPLLSLNGNAKAIEKLITILMDNALKYSPEGGTITLNVSQQNKNIQISVVNTADVDVTPENLCHVFDRFYRTDASRNSETGGHGIGLSVAKAITVAHGGQIRASSSDGHSFHITVTLPR